MTTAIIDKIKVEMVREWVLNTLNEVFGEDLPIMRLKRIECNITKDVMQGCSCSDVLKLINHSYTEGVNLLAQRASPRCKYFKETESLRVTQKNYYILKCYNKARQQKIKGELLRIEAVMQDRIIQRVLGTRTGIDDVLTADRLVKVMEEYKRIFCDDLLKNHIEPCREGITEILYNSLLSTGKPIETVTEYREIIVDECVLRVALKRWYKAKGVADNSRQYFNGLKFKFPKNVFKTMYDFYESCC